MEKIVIRGYDDIRDSWLASINKFKQRIKKDKSLKLSLSFSRDDFFKDDFDKKLNERLDFILANNVGLKNVVLNINVFMSSNLFNNKEWEKITDVQKKYAKKGLTVCVEDMDKMWSLDEVANANQHINEVANKVINRYHFSPFEKLMVAYSTVKQRNYIEVDDKKDAYMSRTLYGILNSDKIVCVGYTAYLKGILDKVADENIKLFENSICCMRTKDNHEGYHRNAIIYIKDEKYNIDGYYYLDPTWDSEEKDLNFFMVPLDDIKYISGYNMITNSQTKRFELSISGDFDKSYIGVDFVNNIMNNPKFKKDIVNAYSEAVYDGLNEKLNSIEKKYDIINKCKVLLNEHGINYIKTSEMFYDINKYSYLTTDKESQTINYVIDYIKRYNQKLPELQQDVKKIIKDKIWQELEEATKPREISKTTMELFKNVSEDLKKLFASKEPVIKTEEKQKYFDKIWLMVEDYLDNSPDFWQKVFPLTHREMESNINRIHFFAKSLINEDSNLTQSYLDLVKKSLSNINPQVEELSKEVCEEQVGLTDFTKELKENNYLEDKLKQKIRILPGKALNILAEKSRVIDYQDMRKVYHEVLKKKLPTEDKGELFKDVETFMNKVVKIADKTYDIGAKNAFAEISNFDKQPEDKLEM